MNTPRLRWTDPPERPDWDDIARKLRERPDDWAFVGVHAVAVASHVRVGRLAAFRPAGHYEARYERVDAPGRAALWIRYVGAPQEETSTE